MSAKSINNGKLLGYLAIDQYGQQIRLTLPNNPRKQLLDKLGVRSCKKQYCDMKQGPPQHTGYIANGRWFTIYGVTAWYGKSTL